MTKSFLTRELLDKMQPGETIASGVSKDEEGHQVWNATTSGSRSTEIKFVAWL